MAEKVQQQYNASSISILEGLEAVRKRPGMYIGSVSTNGLNHLIYEIADNSVDEHLAGYCDTISVTLNNDGSATITDNGRGIPVGIHPKAGIPAVEVVFTILHAGGKFGDGGYKISGGLHGVGASVVNALSTWLEVDIFHEGKIYRQRYERGKVMYPLKIVGDTDKRGTEVRFLPDPTIFEETIFDFSVLKQRLREMAFLTKNIKIVLRDDRPEEPIEKTFHYEGGIKEFVTYLNKGKTPLYPDIIYCEGMKDNIYVEVAMQHNDGYTEGSYSFVNNITTPEGGTHLTGFKNALTKTFNSYARLNKLIKDTETLSGDDIREGLTVIVSIKIEDPQFEGQTKQKLGNSEARGAVDNIVSEQLMIYLDGALQVEQKKYPDKEIVPAGVFYYNVKDPMIQEKIHADVESVSDQMLKKLKMNGLVQADDDVSFRIDNTLSSIPVSVNKDGNFSRRSSVASRKQFDALGAYVRQKICDIRESILDGNAAVEPYELGKKNACTYCPYSTVCGFDRKIPGYEFHRLPSFSENDLWKKIVKDDE